MLNYSVLKASTGSFLLAILDGISPAIIVSIILIMTNITPPATGRIAIFEIPNPSFTKKLIINESITVTPIPNNPATNPIINVSALNTLDMSFLEAPIALKIPISFVLSSTDIYVIIPIIIDETINDIATNAINT